MRARLLAWLAARLGLVLGLRLATRYRVECWASDGRLRWVEEVPNLVTTEGFNTILDRCFKTVPANVNWFVGLKGAGAPAAGDTMASHAGWAELTPYTEATRPAFTPGAISSGSVDNSAAKASFSINATATIAGAFLVANSTKGGTTGPLYGVADFAAARDVVNGDTLNVQATLTAS